LKTKLIVAGLLVAGSALAGSAQAALIHQSTGWGLATTSWTQSFSALSKFDEALGVLNKVTLGVRTDLYQELYLENLGSTDDVAQPFASATVVVKDSTGKVWATNSVDNPAGEIAVSAFDGVIDWAGTSGYAYTPYQGSSVQEFLFSSASDLLPFIGGAGNMLNEFSARATGRMTANTNNGNVAASVRTQAGAFVELTYDYTPNAISTVPEPSGLALALAGLGAMPFLRRRSK
jgi:MYXO-CTERM domain-containing protein